MKAIKIIIQISLLLVAGPLFAQSKSFTLIGKVAGKADGYIYLSIADGENGRMDSMQLNQGKFVFTGQLAYPTQAEVLMEKKSERSANKRLPLILEPGEMTLTIDYNQFGLGELKGSISNAEQEMLNKKQASIRINMQPAQQHYNRVVERYLAIREQKDTASSKIIRAEMNAVQKEMEPFHAQIRATEDQVLEHYPNGFTAANRLMYAVGQLPVEESAKRYEALSTGAKHSIAGRYVQSKIQAIRRGSVGVNAPDFTSTDINGIPLTLSAHKGKYVLLDFWASWCVPCRKGNPHLLALYAKYQEKGLEIIGVASDDGNEKAWRKAVEDDKIAVWKHVLSGQNIEKLRKGERDDNYIGGQYGISTLPTKILIDPQGLIIGRYGSGAGTDVDLDQKLTEIFR
ncbi:redoxin domain-containing protein [Sphingobacterium puteale]|uniref:redoxin domain-containing protein n=1 Tax=Sphingobacterium puteale TaxID=2420510 RepID=UPI003D993F7A